MSELPTLPRLLAVSSLLLCLGARAQLSPGTPVVPVTPPVVPTPSELAPKPTPELGATPADVLPQPPAPRELGKPEEEITVDVQSYEVPDSAPAALKAALPKLTAPYVGKGRSFEDLVDAAAEVTRFMQRELGDYLGYAYIPEQPTQTGVIRINVLEGRLDKVILNWDDNLPVKKSVVEGYLAHLHPGDILTVRDVERVVFLINDLRGITVRAEVQAGSQPGTASLVFTPKADPRFAGRLDFDVNGSRFIGITRLGTLLSVNSPTGHGDNLTATTLDSVSGGLKFWLLGYTLPVGSNGLKTGASLSQTRYLLDPTLFPLHIAGTGNVANAFALYPWVRSRNLNVFSLLAFDHKAYTDGIANLQTHKTIRDLSLGLTGDFRDDLLKGGVNTFEFTIAHGRLSYEGGLPSGIDDSPNYTKFDFSYSRLQDILTGRLMGYFATSGQYALDNLDTTEQFRAGGPDAVRAFAPGEGTGDSGLLMTAELRLLPPESWFGQHARDFVFALFADGAIVQIRHNPDVLTEDPGYRNDHGFAGVGVSGVWQVGDRFSTRMSLAFPVHGTPTSDTLKRDPRLYLQSSLSF